MKYSGLTLRWRCAFCAGLVLSAMASVLVDSFATAARARERIRWPLGAVMLFAAVALAPGLMMGMRLALARTG